MQTVDPVGRDESGTSALGESVGRRGSDDDTDTYLDCRGVAGLATALTYAGGRDRGERTHRLMADDLDLSPLAAEIILQALRPVVTEHFTVDTSGGSLDEIDPADASDA